MEVDLWQKPSLDPCSSTSLLPTIDESSALGHQDPKERLVKVLDQVEARVERLRKDAAIIEEEKDTLLATLDAIKHSEWMLELDEVEREDIQHSLSRVLDRCSTVEARVNTKRDQQQEEALNQVNQSIDSLVHNVREDPVFAHGRCQAFMAACSSNTHEAGSGSGSPALIDPHFESVILGCTVDDQKKVKKRLQGLLDYFARLNVRST